MLFERVLPEGGAAVLDADATESAASPYQSCAPGVVIPPNGYGAQAKDLLRLDPLLLPHGQRLKLEVLGRGHRFTLPGRGASSA